MGEGTRYVGEMLEWIEKAAGGRDMNMTLGELLAELREADRAYYTHEAAVISDVALHLAGLLADAEGLSDPTTAAMRAVDIERAAREELYPTA